MKKIILAVALVFVAADLSYGQTCQAFLNGAKARASKNLWKEASEVLAKNVDDCNENAEYMYFYGIVVVQGFPNDSTGRALELIRTADQLNGDPGEGDELQADISQALTALWGPMVNRGIQMLNSGDIEGARAQLEQAVELNPEGLEGHYALGAVYQSQGEYDSAIATYTRALEIDTAHRGALNRLGLTYQEKANALASSGDAAGAIEVAGEAIEIYEAYLTQNPGDLEVKIQLAGLYSNLGRQEEAQPIIQEIAGADEVTAEVLTQLGFAQAQAGNNALADDLLSRAVMLSDTLWSEPLEYLAFVRIRENDLFGARIALEKQLALDPSNAQGWEYLGFVRRDLEDTAGAQEAFGKAQSIPLDLQSASMTQDADETWNVDFTFSNRLEVQVDDVMVKIHLVSETGQIMETKEVTVGPLTAGQTEQVRVEFDQQVPNPRIRYEITS